MNPDIYYRIEGHVNLTEHELAESPHEKRPNYVHTVRGVASDMVKRGELVRVRDGCFRLPQTPN